MAIVSDAYMKALLKTVYLSGVSNLKYQRSPILTKIGKENWEGGREIKYAAQYGDGGNFGSDYALISDHNTTGAQNLEWTMEPGYMFGLFNINQPEILSTASDRGAYMKALSNKMAACFSGMSRTLATYLYGGIAGVIDRVKAATTLASGTNTLTITSAGAIKLDVGSRIVFAAGTPKGTLYGSGAYATVTAIDDNTITIVAQDGLNGVNLAVGDYIELYTARNKSSFQGIEGLSDILPDVDNRTGAGWTSYITTAFRGVDRSVSVSRLAGQFENSANHSGTTPLTDTLVALLKKTKRAGGIDDVIIINDETFEKVGAELGIQRNLWQAQNVSSPEKQSATAGYNQLGVAFSDAFISRTIVDPYCTEDKAYMLRLDDLKIYDMGNIAKAINPVANDSLGKVDIEAVGDQGIGDRPAAELNVDKMFTVVPGAKSSFGPSFEIAAHSYSNFMLKDTAAAGVAVL